MKRPEKPVFPGGSGSEESTCNMGDLASVPGWGRAPGEGNGNPLKYSCLETSLDRGAWRATVYGVAKSWTGLTDLPFHFQEEYKLIIMIMMMILFTEYQNPMQDILCNLDSIVRQQSE